MRQISGTNEGGRCCCCCRAGWRAHVLEERLETAATGAGLRAKRPLNAPANRGVRIGRRRRQPGSDGAADGQSDPKPICSLAAAATGDVGCRRRSYIDIRRARPGVVRSRIFPGGDRRCPIIVTEQRPTHRIVDHCRHFRRS